MSGDEWIFMRPDKKNKLHDVKKILFITLSNLGDIVLTTPVFSKLRENFPNALIDIVSGASGKEIFGSDPSVRNIKVRAGRKLMRERISEIMEWRGEKYDIVVDLRNSLVPLLVGARVSVPVFPGFSRKGHMRDIHLSVLKDLVSDPLTDIRFFVSSSEKDEEYVRNIIQGNRQTEDFRKPFMVVSPGAKSHIKRWPAEKFAELIVFLKRQTKADIFLTGSPADRGSSDKIVSLSGNIVTDITGGTSIGALYSIMRLSTLVITNDSGPLHISSAAGAPTVAIFGPTDEKKYGPLSPLNKVVSSNAGCRPCEKALCSEKKRRGCIAEITVKEVFDSSMELWETSLESRKRET